MLSAALFASKNPTTGLVDCARAASGHATAELLRSARNPAASFKDLVGAGEECRRHFEAERLCSLEIDATDCMTQTYIASSECYISQLRVTGSNLSTRPG